jgi:hypothetical protein
MMKLRHLSSLVVFAVAGIGAAHAQTLTDLGAATGVKADLNKRAAPNALRARQAAERLAQTQQAQSDAATRDAGLAPTARPVPTQTGGPVPGSSLEAPGGCSDGTLRFRLKGTVRVDGKVSAVFDSGNPRPLVVSPGERLDAHTKLVRIDGFTVILDVGGKRVAVTPW